MLEVTRTSHQVAGVSERVVRWRTGCVDMAKRELKGGGVGSGLGWIGAGLSGRGVLRVWAPQGVAVTTRRALIPDYARELERPGFGSQRDSPARPTRRKR